MQQRIGHQSSAQTKRQYADKDIDRLHPCGEQMVFSPQQHCHQHQQNHVLAKCSPIAQVNSIAKAPAVGNRIGDSQIQRQRGHHEHHRQRQPTCHFRPHVEGEQHSQHKLKQDECAGRIRRSGNQLREKSAESIQVILYFIYRAQRVHGLHKAGEDKCQAEQGSRASAENRKRFIVHLVPSV